MNDDVIVLGLLPIPVLQRHRGVLSRDGGWVLVNDDVIVFDLVILFAYCVECCI